MNEGQYRYIKALLECLQADNEKFLKLEKKKDSMDEKRASGNIKLLLKKVKNRK